MQSKRETVNGLEFYPLTPEHWREFEKLFGENGADGGCWCMWWRLPEQQFEAQTGELNKAAMKLLVESGHVPGILAYSNEQAVAWCSVGPRESFPALRRYWQLDNQADNQTWSIVCFFVQEEFRRRGLMTGLIEKAREYAVARGAKVIEGYPIEPDKALTGYDGYTGIVSVYKSLEFTEVSRNLRNEILMRFVCRD